MKGAIEFFLCVVNLRYLHPDNVWDGWEICLFLRKWRRGESGVGKERTARGFHPQGYLQPVARKKRTRKSIPHPEPPRFLGSHLEAQCPELPSPQAPVHKQWVKGSKETLVFHPPFGKRSRCILSFFHPFGVCILECKVHVFLPTNAVLSCF